VVMAEVVREERERREGRRRGWEEKRRNNDTSMESDERMVGKPRVTNRTRSKQGSAMPSQ
jgi:hypothetical protein